MSFRCAAIVAGVLVVRSLAFAEPTFVTLNSDNDWFAHQDRHYTSGSHIAFVKDIADLPASVQEMAPLRWSADHRITLALGQRIYTPGNTNPKPEEPLDRPFAGWVYMQADIRTQTGATVDHLLANVGFIGPVAGGEHIQKISHHLLGSDTLEGWEKQLHNEPTLTLGFERSWPGLFGATAGSLAMDLSPVVGATVGNVYTYANAGVVARIGRNLPDDLPAANITLGPPRDGYRGATTFGWYAWLGADVRAVGWNVFLDGNTFRDSPGVERKPFQHDLQLGFVLAWPRARVGFTFVRRSLEFERQDGIDSFGKVSISFAY